MADGPGHGDPHKQHDELSADKEHSSSDGALETGHNVNGEQSHAATGAPPKSPSRLKRMADRVGLDPFTLILMFKGSLPPTIAVAAYQSPVWAGQYSTLGYLVAIISVLGMAVMPRAKFIQTMSLNLVTVGLAASVNLLAFYCATQARLHTTPAGASLEGYNSSSSAVLAIWLLVQTYLINALRAARPAFQFPVILYSVLMCVSLTYGTEFTTMAQAIAFVEKILEAFLTGFALATGVSLFVIPISSRTVIFKQMTGYMNCLDGMLKSQTAYMASLEEWSPDAARKQRAQQDANGNASKAKGQLGSLLDNPQSAKLRGVWSATYELHGKIQADLNFAKREIGFGRLGANDLSHLWKLLRRLMVPVTGLAAMLDIIQHRAKEFGWLNEHRSEAEMKTHERQIEGLHSMVRSLHGPLATMSGYMHEAIEHVQIVLQLIKPPKKELDVEKSGGAPVPGTLGFAEAHKKRIDDFYESRKNTLRDWCADCGIELPHDFFEPTFVMPEHMKSIKPNGSPRDQYQRQVFVICYLDHLLWIAGMSSLELVLFADQKVQDGTMTRNRLIFPGAKIVKKWIRAVFGQEDLSQEDHYTAEMDAGGSESIDLGASFNKTKDPEHLPPRNAIERAGEAIRVIPAFFRSDASAFGLRVAAATMTVGIACFLEAGQAWFIRNRLLWAMIIVAISMTRTAGQSVFNFLLRVGGTAIAMVGAYVIWYIVDGKTAGVIVFLWLWIFSAYYFILKFPRLIVAAILSLVTALLIIGYELQVKELGKEVSESNGQPAYPTYELAPYRLATVTGGLFVAFIWTIFPYPISEGTEMRKDLGVSLYLLANFFSVVTVSIRSRVQGTYGDDEVKGTRGYHLEKARIALFNKLIYLVTMLRTNSSFSQFQVRVGGQFPKDEYTSLIECVGRLIRNMALLGYGSRAFAQENPNSQWSRDFRQLLKSISAQAHQLTSLLSLLSSALLHGRPLPPYVEFPQTSFGFVKRLESIDHDILSIRHIAEPEYAAFAIMQIAGQAILDDTREIHKHVKTLVGEIDFSFHIISTNKDISDDDLSDE